MIKKLIIISYIIILISSVYTFILDYLVSYTVFKYDFRFFYSHEGSRIFAESLARHILPYQIIGLHVFLYLGYTITTFLGLYILDKRYDNKMFSLIAYSTVYTCYIMLSILMIYTDIVHILGALSWL